MGGGPIIIIDPKRQQLLIEEWRHGWKLLSVWVFALIGASPDIYAGIVAMGWLEDPAVPQSFVWGLRGMAALGIMARFIKQSRAESKDA